MALRLTETRFVALVAVLAAAARLPSVCYPLSPDEAGFLLVARSWSPSSDSLYGPYFVDRSPILIGLIRLSDDLGGPYFLRVLGGLATMVLVVACARTGHLIGGERAARWSAVSGGALAASLQLDSAHTKGEILGVALVATSICLSLEALAKPTRARALWLAATAGLAATTAVGLKQNLVTALVFGGVVLLGAVVTGRIALGRFAALTLAAILGAAVPVLGVVAWSQTAGVGLDELWYAVFGFRSAANDVISGASTAAPDARARTLALTFLSSGMAFVVLAALLAWPRIWRLDRVLALALVAVLATDLTGLILGGSFWRPYLINPIPGVALAAGLLAATSPQVSDLRTWGGRAVGLVALSTSLTLAGWGVQVVAHGAQTGTIGLGDAIEAVAEPDDSIVAYGGNAQIVWTSGLREDYPYLWSLPMRVEDPGLRQLQTLLAGPNRPTWVVLAVPLTSWDLAGHQQVETLLDRHYALVGTGCSRPIYLARGADRRSPDCAATSD